MIKIWSTPDGFAGTNVTLKMLIQQAYGVQDFQITGGPSWLNTEKYDIEAKADKSATDGFDSLSKDQRKVAQDRMLQALWADRFKLTLHHGTKELPAYKLVVAENGPKLQEAKPGETYANGIKGPDGRPAGPGMVVMGRGIVTAQALPAAEIARLLSDQLGLTVVDKTELKSKYDFTLLWTPVDGQLPGFKEQASSQSASSAASLFTLIQEQLGLKLEQTNSPVEILVVDHAEKPSED
jgi:uncharacterized protein (TIGR03435 family)